MESPTKITHLKQINIVDYLENKYSEKGNAKREYESFSANAGPAECSNPRAYWSTFGKRDYPLLAEVALIVFYVQKSAGQSERAWSTMAFIETKNRNRLNDMTLNKIDFCKINAIYMNKQTPIFDEDDYF